MAYTDKPVTLADVMSIRGEPLMPPVLHPGEEDSLSDSDELDIGKLQNDQIATPGIPATAASDKERPVSVKKKKVVFLSEWSQEKLNAEQDLALKQLVKVCVCACVCACVCVRAYMCMHVCHQ